jgi:azurin
MPAPSDGGSVTLEIASASSDNLEYASDSLTASAGAEVTLTFSNNAVTQQHNWVLVQDGTKDTVANAGLLAELAGIDNDWVSPDDANVIVNTKLTSAGESDQITFTAPAAGTYQFVCTFPGHNLTMFGTFEVTP